MLRRVPSPTAIFVGREPQLTRLQQALVHVPVAVICGVPGIGKSTLAFSVAQRWTHPTVYHRIVDGEALGRLLDDVRRAIAVGPVPAVDEDDERMADLAERLDRARALLVLDDLHRLDRDCRSRLLVGLGQLLRLGRMLATTRERTERDPAIDWLELHLQGLDETSGRALWTALDELHQPSPGFKAAWRRAQGNPLVLRQAHCGGPVVDPRAAAIAGLSGDERYLAGVLALAGTPLSTAALDPLLPDARARAARDRLHAQLIVDVLPDGTCALHDLFRDELQRTMSAGERASCHADLADLLQRAELDVVTRVRELCRHLGALDRFEDAAQLLVAHAAEFVRRGAARDLLVCLEAIPRPRRTTVVEIAYARTLGRLHDPLGGYRALEPLFESGAEPRLEVLLGVGPLALHTGRLDAAERAFSELLARRDLGSWERVRAQCAFAVLRTHQGRGDDGRAFLRHAAADAASPETQGVLATAEVYCCWLDELDAEMIEPLRLATARLPGGPATLHLMQLAPAALALGLGRLGRFTEAEPWLHHVAEPLARSTDARSHVLYRAALAHLAYERGARAEALAGLDEAGARAETGGDVVSWLRIRVYAARLLLVMGRRRQALGLLDEATAQARALGMHSAARAAERSRLHDPVAQLRDPDPADVPSTKLGVLVRARCMEALRAARDGDRDRVTARLGAIAPLPAGPDYALDRALACLARAVLARAEGDPRLAASELAAAQREARSGDVDPEVLDDLDAELGHLRVVTAERTLLRASYEDAARSDAIVLDGRSHELRIGGRVHTLKRQAMLREFLYALCARQGSVVSKQEVANRLWGGRYDPMVHDNRLWANVRRLRTFLAPSGLSIEFVDDGYRIAPRHDFVFVAPSK